MYRQITFPCCAYLLALICLFPVYGSAEQAKLQPFVLAFERPGLLKKTVVSVKGALTGRGFEVLGEYSPYPDNHVIAITNKALRKAALATKEGAFGAALRVSVVQSGKKIQVAYTNPIYLGNVYRMPNLAKVALALEEALGKSQTFGATPGFSAKKLRKYHYRLGMEYFSDLTLLAKHANYKIAAGEVASGLAFRKEGTFLVYRIDFPRKQQTLFGVGLRMQRDGNKFMDDKHIMGEIDHGKLKHTAHLPYEILVKGRNVYALHPRFRIAINFPDIKMLGKHNFSRLIRTPRAILKALTITAGGEWDEED